jgi:N-acetylglutamate synthase/N-acetylornithine aminotransferase
VAETLEEHGALLDQLTASIEDPAEVFAASVRMTVRLHKTHPQIAQIMTNTGVAYLNSPTGLAPRALRDLANATAAGRFSVDDPVVALACTGGSILAVLHILDAKSGAEIDRAADEVAANLLRMFGMSGTEANEIVARPLPKPARSSPAS